MNPVAIGGESVAWLAAAGKLRPVLGHNARDPDEPAGNPPARGLPVDDQSPS
jgi:hypothetical protein